MRLFWKSFRTAFILTVFALIIVHGVYRIISVWRAPTAHVDGMEEDIEMKILGRFIVRPEGESSRLLVG